MSFNRRRFLKTTAGAALAAPALMKSAMAGSHDAIKFVSILCLLYTSPSPRDKRQSRMPSSA